MKKIHKRIKRYIPSSLCRYSSTVHSRSCETCLLSLKPKVLDNRYQGFRFCIKNINKQVEYIKIPSRFQRKRVFRFPTWFSTSWTVIGLWQASHQRHSGCQRTPKTSTDLPCSISKLQPPHMLQTRNILDQVSK